LAVLDQLLYRLQLAILRKANCVFSRQAVREIFLTAAEIPAIELEIALRPPLARGKIGAA
jgi:hypothetical protein